MPHKIKVELEVTIRKPRGDEIDELGFEREEVREFDLESVESRDMAEDMNAYFEECTEEFAMEILSGSGWPFVISKIKANECPERNEP